MYVDIYIYVNRSLSPLSFHRGKFKDGTDNIDVGGFFPVNLIRGSNVIFLCSFHNNDAMLSQFHVLNMLCEAFVESITVMLLYYPTGHDTDNTSGQHEGVVATSNTLARLFSNLPRVGKPVRIMTYDIHTLQSRFYLSGAALATLHTAVPLLIRALQNQSKINCLAFADEGGTHSQKSALQQLTVVHVVAS